MVGLKETPEERQYFMALMAHQLMIIAFAVQPYLMMYIIFVFVILMLLILSMP